MPLDAAALSLFQASAGNTFQNASTAIHDEYVVASNLVENILEWLINSQIRIFVPGVNPSGTLDVWSTDETSQGKILNIVLNDNPALRISLEASLVASFRDTGPTGYGESGLRIFCNQSITEEDAAAWENAVFDIIQNNGSEEDGAEIIDEFTLGYPYFISQQVEWIEVAALPYAAAEAVTEILDGGEELFSGPLGMKTQMEINTDTMSSSEDAGIDFANAINQATVGATVTSMFTNGTFIQASLEVATIE